MREDDVISAQAKDRMTAKTMDVMTMTLMHNWLNDNSESA